MPVLLVQRDIFAAADMYMGVEKDGLERVVACHWCASHVFGRAADWCRTFGLQAVRIDARLVETAISASDLTGIYFNLFAAYAEDTGIVTDDEAPPQVSEDELENKASKLAIGDQQ